MTTPTPPDWPTAPPTSEELQKVVLEAEVREIAELRRAFRSPKGRSDYAVEMDKAGWAAERELDKQFQQAVMEVYKSGLDRSRSAAELVQKSAAGVGTIYAGLLALAFSVSENPLPARATIPGIFLGFAIVFSTAYLAYRWRPAPGKRWDPHSGHRENQIRRLQWFGKWIATSVNRRSYILRSSVVALGFGVATLPLPFLAIDQAVSAPASTVPDPPGFPAGAPVEVVELLKIQYQAQIDAEQAKRETALGRKPRTVELALVGTVSAINALSWGLAAVGLAAMLIVPAATRGPRVPKEPPRSLLDRLRARWT